MAAVAASIGIATAMITTPHDHMHAHNVMVSFNAETSGTASCAASDAQMSKLRQTVCRSFVGSATPWCQSDKDIKAAGDWPHQTVYLLELLKFMVAPSTCLNTSYAAETFEWFNGPFANVSVGGSFMWTWLDFQVGYYRMPQKAGSRIESAWTLGEKCWAFTVLQQKLILAPIEKASSSVGQSIANFTANYNKAVPLTMNLCREVMANCFVNASYDPSRKGTCPLKVDEFKGGFGWENLKFGNLCKYPF